MTLNQKLSLISQITSRAGLQLYHKQTNRTDERNPSNKLKNARARQSHWTCLTHFHCLRIRVILGNWLRFYRALPNRWDASAPPSVMLPSDLPKAVSLWSHDQKAGIMYLKGFKVFHPKLILVRQIDWLCWLCHRSHPVLECLFQFVSSRLWIGFPDLFPMISVPVRFRR